MIRKRIKIIYSKSGVDQEANVFLHNGRLLTDKVTVEYNTAIFLKTQENLKTEADVLEFFKAYSYTGKIKTYESDYTNLKLKELMDIEINIKILDCIVYWGLYTMTFKDGFVNMVYRGSTIDGTHKLNGKKDFFRVMDMYFDRYSELDLIKYIHSKM